MKPCHAASPRPSWTVRAHHAVKVQGLNYSPIAIRLGLSSSTVGRIAREHCRRVCD